MESLIETYMVANSLQEIPQEWRAWTVSYDDIISSFGRDISIAVRVDDNDYQGDTRLLLQRRNQYGFIIFGWGSCSGCDALQACGSWEEAEQLAISLYQEIKWFNSKEEALNFFMTHDWKGDFSWHNGLMRNFLHQSVLCLGGSVEKLDRRLETYNIDG